jgi:hypothetical protein
MQLSRRIGDVTLGKQQFERCLKVEVDAAGIHHPYSRTKNNRFQIWLKSLHPASIETGEA